MDAFFASVEQRDNPELKGKPIAVGGGNLRGVVAAASYEARKFGVRSAMSSAKAAQLCPDLIFVKPRFDSYKKASVEIKKVFLKYTKTIEPLSLDEAYLDISILPKGFESATALAEQIRNDIFEATKLTASAGISYNKFLAKTASDVNKPNGQFVITPKKAKPFLGQLEIRKFYGIGKVTAAKFQKMGILYGSDLQKQKLTFLEQHFGKSAKAYYNLSRGIDFRPVKAHGERKSVGAERTFRHDIKTREDLIGQFEILSKTVSEKCNTSKKKGRTVTIKIKYSDFIQITRSYTNDEFKNDSTTIFEISKNLCEEAFDFDKGIRLIGVTVSNFEPKKKNGFEQLELPF